MVHNKRKRKTQKESEDELEEEYESKVKIKAPNRTLLPLKRNDGYIITRSVKIEEKEEDEHEEEQVESEGSEPEDSDDEFLSGNKRGLDSQDLDSQDLDGQDLDGQGLDSGGLKSNPISTAKLLAKRSEALEQKKIHIGVLSSGLLENPEEKIMNLSKLIKMLDDESADAYLTVRKLVIVALLEVFKDLLPSYSIKHHEDSKEVKLKKDTLRLQKYEDSLLIYYKKYLQKLEKFAEILIKKFGDGRKRNPEQIILAELSVHALCDLLVTHPYFNYSQNIAQVTVPFLNNPNKNVRELVKAACKTVFKEDKKDDITLKILRILNQYLRTRAHNVNPDMLEILLSLKIKNVNLDRDVEQDMKEKKLKSHKGNVMQLSKKERKRKKKLQGLEQELLETKAQESKQLKQKNLTEITKIIFGIYFRILKSSSNTKVVGICLEGLAKFAHCINFTFYFDIVNVLEKLIKEDFLGYKESLFIIQTVFSILSGVGEAINVDPSRFYKVLYENLLEANAGRSHEVVKILLDTLDVAIVKRRKKITNKRSMGFVKRATTLSLNLLHNGTLACLAFVRSMINLNSAMDILLDLDTDVGDGKYQPEVNDPEYCNAASTSLYELALLIKHYNPVVGRYARHIGNGCPSSGEGSLPVQFVNCGSQKLFEDFDMSQMAFNPSIPIPKKSSGKSRPKPLTFVNSDFRTYCYNVSSNSKMKEPFFINC